MRHIPSETREEETTLVKEAIKEGIKEWADEQFATFGKWTLRSVAAAAFTMIVVYLANHGGFK